MTPEKHESAYYKEIDFIRELENRNDNFRDQTLIQISVGLFAVLATFGKDVLLTNKTLSVVIFSCLAATILVLVTGFLTSSKLYESIRVKMTNNVLEGKEFYDKYADTAWQQVNTILNIASYVFFVLSIIFSAALIFTYIGGLHA